MAFCMLSLRNPILCCSTEACYFFFFLGTFGGDFSINGTACICSRVQLQYILSHSYRYIGNEQE